MSKLKPTITPHYLDYKEPLTKVKGGYGFMGVITTNEEQTHVQCHICGYYFESLGSHVQHTHKMKAREYKEKYQLRISRGLLAPKAREALIRRTANGRQPNQVKTAYRTSQGQK